MLQATLRPKAAIVSKKLIIFTFSHPKAYVTKFDLGIIRSRSTQGHNLNNLGSACIDNATYQVSRSSVNWFWRRIFFKVLTIYGHCCHVGHVTQLICIKFNSHSHLSSHMSFGSKLPICFCEKQVLTLKSE